MRSSAGRSTEADVGAQRPRIVTLLAGRVGRAVFFAVGTLATACALAAWTLVTPLKPAPRPFAQARSPVGRLALTLPATPREVAELESRAAADETAENLARLGGTWLANGHRDRAIGKLEEALAKWPRNGAVNNQLAVAYLDRAIAGERPIDLVRALGAANRAMVTSPRTPEPPFNRALVLQRLELREVARRAWQDVAAREVDPRWLRQAKSHLQRLDAQPAQRSWERDREELERAAKRGETSKVAAIVERWPEPARLFGEEDLLARWASAAAAGQEAEAKEALATAEAIGSALAHRRGDLVLGDAVAAIARRAVAPRGGPSQAPRRGSSPVRRRSAGIQATPPRPGRRRSRACRPRPGCRPQPHGPLGAPLPR